MSVSVVVETIARKLGGADVLGHEVRSQADLVGAVRARLPLAALSSLGASGISPAEMEALVIPERTRRHRAMRQESLTVEESDRAVRVARVQTLAEETFGEPDKAARWLRRPLGELGGAAPLAVAATETGARLIETVLGKIAWGAAA